MQQDFRDIDDEQFLAQCRFEAFRGSGPGGQKRNKTSSGVRLVHIPTGLSATATERRSQARNRSAALRRLRHRAAMEIRQPVDLQAGVCLPPPGLDATANHPRYPAIMGRVLDVLEAADWRISSAAGALACSTGRLVRFLAADKSLWGHVNHRRAARSLRPLLDRP